MATLVIRFKGKQSMLVKIDWHYMSIFFQSRFVREVMTVVGRYIFGQNLFGTGHRDQLETL